jgi:hypothetical protein
MTTPVRFTATTGEQFTVPTFSVPLPEPPLEGDTLVVGWGGLQLMNSSPAGTSVVTSVTGGGALFARAAAVEGGEGTVELWYGVVGTDPTTLGQPVVATLHFPSQGSLNVVCLEGAWQEFGPHGSIGYAAGGTGTTDTLPARGSPGTVTVRQIETGGSVWSLQGDWAAITADIVQPDVCEYVVGPGSTEALTEAGDERWQAVDLTLEPTVGTPLPWDQAPSVETDAAGQVIFTCGGGYPPVFFPTRWIPDVDPTSGAIIVTPID